MAFCTSCGAQMADDARFCTGCGKPAGPPTAGEAAPRPAPVTVQKNSALTIVLVVFVVVIGLGVVATAGAFFFGYKLMKRSRVESQNGSTRVITPLGSVVANQDAEAVAGELGVEIYPGARGLPGGSAVKFGDFKVVAARFESDDPPEKVGAFYHSHYPKAEIQVRDQRQQTMIVNTSKGMIAIKIEQRDGGSSIEISNVGGGVPSPGGEEKSQADGRN
jgi:hypothetical protein